MDWRTRGRKMGRSLKTVQIRTVYGFTSSADDISSDCSQGEEYD